MAQDLPRRTSSAATRRRKRAASEDHVPRNDVGRDGRSSQTPLKAYVAVADQETTIVKQTFSPPKATTKDDAAVSIGASPPQDEQSRAKRLFESKRQARRRRQSLKESGDFLGVQGVNPETGEMDILTPTTSSDSTRPLGLLPRLGGAAQVLIETKQAYREAKRQYEAELMRTQSSREQEKMDKIEKEKEAIRVTQRGVRWRKDVGQWSSVAEPNLSPIAQSQRSGTTCRPPPK